MGLDLYYLVINIYIYIYIYIYNLKLFVLNDVNEMWKLLDLILERKLLNI